MAKREQTVAAERAAGQLDAAQAGALESKLREQPEDLATLETLLVFYDRSGDRVVGKEQTMSARRRHILWLIAHHPEHTMAGDWPARLFSSRADRNPDPEGYRLARAAWLERIEPAGASSAVLANAATFFEVADKPISEQLYLRLREREPEAGWIGRLARLYSRILVGSNASEPHGVVRSMSTSEANGPLALAVRKKLEQSSDARLLAGTGMMLVLTTPEVRLGESYIERAVALDPNLPDVRRAQRMMRQRERAQRGSLEARYAALGELKGAERDEELALLAEAAYLRGERQSSFAQARQWASEAASAPTQSARMSGQLVLGLVAMQEGDRKEALRRMGASVDAAPAADAGEPVPVSMAYRLASWLLKDGERESVIAFLERMAAAAGPDRPRFLESAQYIRQGVQPEWYLR